MRTTRSAAAAATGRWPQEPARASGTRYRHDTHPETPRSLRAAREAEADPRQPVTPTSLLALQHLAGNRAATLLMQRRDDRPTGGDRTRTAPRPTSAGTAPAIQRLVGFEFELNVPVSLDDAEIPSTAPKGMRKTYEFVMAKGLEEKTELADRGYAGGGFKVVVDHGPISEKVDSYKRLFTEDIYVGETVRENFGADAYETGRLEYVTAALDETRPDYQKAFTDQLNPLVVSIKALRNKDPAHNAIPSGEGIDVLIGIPAELSVPLTRAGQEAGELLDDESYEPVFTAEKAMRADVHFQSYMQATAGVDTQRVGTFLRQEAADAGDYVSTPLHVAVVLATRDHSPGVIARILQVSDLARYDARTNSEVEGFLTLLLQYVIGDCIWQTIPEAQSIPKNIGPFWIKMDLATYRGRLPQPAQDLLKTVTSRAYKELLAMHGRLLQERMPKSGRTREPAIDLIQNFLSGALAGDSDGFTEPMLTNFDQLGGGGQGAPLEFRSIRAHPSPDEIVGTAMAVVEKVRRTNG